MLDSRTRHIFDLIRLEDPSALDRYLLGEFGNIISRYALDSIQREAQQTLVADLAWLRSLKYSFDELYSVVEKKLVLDDSYAKQNDILLKHSGLPLYVEEMIIQLHDYLVLLPDTITKDELKSSWSKLDQLRNEYHLAVH